jgi:hypothetical protein
VLAALVDRLAATAGRALPYARQWTEIEPANPQAQAPAGALLRAAERPRGVVVPLPVAPPQQVRFCRTRDGVRIAYATRATVRRWCGRRTG